MRRYNFASSSWRHLKALSSKDQSVPICGEVVASSSSRSPEVGGVTSENQKNYVEFTIDPPRPSPATTQHAADEHLRTIHSSKLYIDTDSGHWRKLDDRHE